MRTERIQIYDSGHFLIEIGPFAASPKIGVLLDMPARRLLAIEPILIRNGQSSSRARMLTLGKIINTDVVLLESPNAVDNNSITFNAVDEAMRWWRPIP